MSKISKFSHCVLVQQNEVQAYLSPFHHFQCKCDVIQVAFSYLISYSYTPQSNQRFYFWQITMPRSRRRKTTTNYVRFLNIFSSKPVGVVFQRFCLKRSNQVTVNDSHLLLLQLTWCPRQFFGGKKLKIKFVKHVLRGYTPT